MQFKIARYCSMMTILLVFLTIRTNEPLYINGELIPSDLANKARELLNVSKQTINIQLLPSKFEELKNILAQYKILVSNPSVAVSRDYWLELQKKKILD